MTGKEIPLAALLREERRFEPSPEFRAGANASDAGIYTRATADPEAFWEEFASELERFRPWEKVLEWMPPHAQWFVGGPLTLKSPLSRLPSRQGL